MANFINRFEESFIALLLAGMVLVTFSQVVARYVFNTGAVWALELTTYLFAWLVLFGMSYGVKIGAHLGVDAFVKLFPDKIQRLLVLFSALCCLAYGGILLFGAWEYVGKMYKIGLPTEDLYVPDGIVEWWNAQFGTEYEDEMSVPLWIPLSILPIGLTLLIYRFAEATYLIITGKRKAIAASHEAEDMVERAHEFAEDEGLQPGETLDHLDTDIDHHPHGSKTKK